MTRNQLSGLVALLAIAGIVVVVVLTGGGHHHSASSKSERSTGSAVAASAAPKLADQNNSAFRTEVADVRKGIVVYRDLRASAANAPDIPIGKRVLVACKAPNRSGITTINAFYLIATPPWRGLLASANQFANGAPVGVTTNADPIDKKVKNCRLG
jgi:hypothetical protein